jgi:hypothetical protein
MKQFNGGKRSHFSIFILLLVLLLGVLEVHGHGPKGHDNQGFTHLSAVKKGIDLYEKLLTAGKLEERWEMGLTKIEVLKKVRNGNSEFVVKFVCSTGKPNSLYIFFNENGKYSGSNFTGK